MLNTKHLLTSLTLTAVIALAGCFPGVYKIDIQQGNVVTQDMIDELRPGMSKAQVRYIMGNPLITDTFHAKRWDYLYSLQTGGGKKSQKRMSLYFNEDDQLIAASGDFRLKPGTTRDEAIFGADATARPTPAPIAQESQLPTSDQDEPQAASISPPEPSNKAPETTPPIPLSDDRSVESDAPAPGSVEEQIQQELDAAQPIQQQQPGQL